MASPNSPLDASTFTEAELRAAVEAAENWGTYVTVHAYTPVSIQRAIAAGVKCIEHGHLMDEPTARLIAEKGIWLSTQAFPDELADAFPVGSQERAKAFEVFDGTDRTFGLAKKYKIKTAFGTDILFSAKLARRQGELLAKLVRWYTPAETLAMATGTNAQLLALSGKRNPYPGKLGVVEQGALADLLLVDGDPIANIKLIEDPAKNFVVIMKDGKIYKNTLDPLASLLPSPRTWAPSAGIACGVLASRAEALVLAPRPRHSPCAHCHPWEPTLVRRRPALRDAGPWAPPGWVSPSVPIVDRREHRLAAHSLGAPNSLIGCHPPTAPVRSLLGA